MRVRRIAILIDGGFFIKRLPRLVDGRFSGSPQAVADSARILCKRHVQRLIGEPERVKDSRWLDHVYRLFYYDAHPYDGVAHHPLANRQIQYAKTEQARFREDLFRELRRKRKFALRLGKVARESDWRFHPRLTAPLLKTREWLHLLEAPLLETPLMETPGHDTDSAEGQPGPAPPLTEDRRRGLEKLVAAWKALGDADISLGLRQKGVDMRIGLDITSITLKKQADTIILVTGDSDFVPAAKLARREGVEFILDPMWQSVQDDLFEHIDGLVSVLRNENRSEPQEAED